MVAARPFEKITATAKEIFGLRGESTRTQCFVTLYEPTVPVTVPTIGRDVHEVPVATPSIGILCLPFPLTLL